MNAIKFFNNSINHQTPKPQLSRKLLILKTNIQTPQQLREIRPLFQRHPFVIDWSVDTEDVDCVLRIEAFVPLTETKVIQLVEAQGFYCDVLPD